MKIKKLKKEINVSLANFQTKRNKFFLFELKQPQKELSNEKILYSRTFVKLISKNVKFSENFSHLPLKFPLTLKVFDNFENIQSYLSDQRAKKESKVVFVKISNIVIKGNDLNLIPTLDPVNSFNLLTKLLDRVIPVVKVLNLQK